MPRGRKGNGARQCRYTYDTWYEDGYLFVQVTGLQYERATIDGFCLAARRKLRAVLIADGVPVPQYDRVHQISWVVEHDRSRNIADGLLETMTYRTLNPVLDEAAA